MRSNLIRYLFVSASLFLALPLAKDLKTEARAQDQEARVIQVTAKKYEFSPSVVHVKAGTKVQLEISAIDTDHGFKSATVPDGADPSTRLGLEFSPPQGRAGWKLKKDQMITIEFLAKTPGRYEFRCSVACGIHHGRMKAQLVVDP